MADVVRERIPFYRDATAVSIAELRDSCTANLRYVFTALAEHTPPDPTAAAETGTQRAQSGVPLATVMAAYRVGFRYMWEKVVSEARRLDVPNETVLEATAQAMVAQDLFTHEMATAYNRRMTAQIVRQETERAALAEAVLTGSITDRKTLWEAADLLGLPTTGRYVVVAAELPAAGRLALDDIAAVLGEHGIRSAWRLLPELQVGIVALDSEDASGESYESLIKLLQQHADSRIGVSPIFDDLTQTGQSLELARLTVASGLPGRTVSLFEENPVGIAAVSAPAVMQRVAANVLAPLNALPDDERQMLLQTLRVWIDAGGSTTKAASRLFCHPNTIRYRLRRIEEQTGRQLNRPADAAAVCLALQVESSKQHGRG
ncbi:PucR family transcriptional regulator [Skermania sp. ID1734]|nr:PucR family transcriptional regulator [Skermania sp. ID1734]